MLSLTNGWIIALNREEVDLSGLFSFILGSIPHAINPSGVDQDSMKVPPHAVSISPNV